MPSPTAPTISQLEQQIAKVQVALEKARAQQLAHAEKATANANKAVDIAQNKLTYLLAKPVTTPAAELRVATAKTVLKHHSAILADAQQHLALLLKAQKRRAKIAKKAAKIVKSKRSSAQKKLDKIAKKLGQQNATEPAAPTSATTPAAAPAKAAPRKRAPVRKKPVAAMPVVTSSTAPETVNPNTINPELIADVIPPTPEPMAPIEPRARIEQVDTNN